MLIVQITPELQLMVGLVYLSNASSIKENTSKLMEPVEFVESTQELLQMEEDALKQIATLHRYQLKQDYVGIVLITIEGKLATSVLQIHACEGRS